MEPRLGDLGFTNRIGRFPTYHTWSTCCSCLGMRTLNQQCSELWDQAWNPEHHMQGTFLDYPVLFMVLLGIPRKQVSNQCFLPKRDGGS